MKLVSILIYLLLTSTNVFAESDWNGYFVSVGVGNIDTTSKQSYSHIRPTAACDNNNFGSIGNGANCTGSSEDLQKNYKNTANLSSLNLRVGKYWAYGAYVVGVLGEYTKSSTFDKANQDVISSGFGDTLSVSTKQNNSVAILGLIGLPINQFLPYLTGGISSTEIKASVTQNIVGSPPLNLPRTFDGSERKLGYSLGGGLKWVINNSFILSGEYLFTDYNNMKLDADRYIPPTGGGNKYPVTHLVTDLNTNNFKVNLEYKF